MGSLDVPEILILASFLGALAWAIYNWTHPQPQRPK